MADEEGMFSDASEEGMFADAPEDQKEQLTAPPAAVATESPSSADAEPLSGDNVGAQAAAASSGYGGKPLAPLPPGFRRSAEARSTVTFAEPEEADGETASAVDPMAEEEFPALTAAPPAAASATAVSAKVWGALPPSVSVAPAPRTTSTPSALTESDDIGPPSAAARQLSTPAGVSAPPITAAAATTTDPTEATKATSMPIPAAALSANGGASLAAETAAMPADSGPIKLAEQEVSSITLDKSDPFAKREGVMSDLMVVDTAGFIKNAPLERLAKRVVTVREVVSEIRDKVTRERMQVLPYELELREPSAKALLAVTDFARLTGDLIGLSTVDLKVLALAYMMEVELNGGDGHLHKTPRAPRGGRGAAATDKPPGPQAAAKGSSSSNGSAAGMPGWDAGGGGGWEQVPAKVGPSEKVQVAPGPTTTKAFGLPEKDDGWINPANIGDVSKSLSRNDSKQTASVSVGCMTTDFAMQNVLLQMGMNVVAVDGMLVRRVKTFVLKCETCFRETHDVTRQFCPSCGKPTLYDKYKVTFTVDRHGNTRTIQGRHRKTKLRGTIFSVPAPKGGRQENLVLREDQREMTRPRHTKKSAADVWDRDSVNMQSPFVTTHKLNQKGGGTQARNAPVVGYGRRNPNVSKATRKGKRNK